MERWLVELTGSEIDLEEFPRWFPDGEVYAIAIDKKVYLTGLAFERFDKATEVRDFAIARLDELYGVISVLWDGLHKPAVNVLYREDAMGKRLQHPVLVAESGTFRSKTTAHLTAEGEATKTQAQILLTAAKRSRPLTMALLIWADPNRTWPRLYRILDELESYLGEPLNKAGFCARAERIRFTNTANTDAAGIDSRHGSEMYDVPKNPMTLREGTEFIRKMIEAMLRHEVNKNT